MVIWKESNSVELMVEPKVALKADEMALLKDGVLVVQLENDLDALLVVLLEII
jgi:hypothetical protein